MGCMRRLYNLQPLCDVFKMFLQFIWNVTGLLAITWAIDGLWCRENKKTNYLNSFGTFRLSAKLQNFITKGRRSAIILFILIKKDLSKHRKENCFSIYQKNANRISETHEILWIDKYLRRNSKFNLKNVQMAFGKFLSHKRKNN